MNETHSLNEFQWNSWANETQRNYEPSCAGPPKTGHSGEFWKEVIHWRRKWQTTSVFLLGKTHEQYEKAKRYDTGRWAPQVRRCPVWYWGRAERVPWAARRSNQSILKEIRLEYSLEGLVLKLKLQYFDHLMQRADLLEPWCWERLKAGEGDDRGWESWTASPTQWTRVWASSARWWRTGKPGMLQFMGSPRVRHDWATEKQSERIKWHKWK